MKFKDQEEYFNNAKENFQKIFNLNPDNNLELFLKYMNEISTRELVWEIQVLQKLLPNQ